MFLVSFFTSWQCRPRFGLAWSGSELSRFPLYTPIYATLTYLRTKFKGEKPLFCVRIITVLLLLPLLLRLLLLLLLLILLLLLLLFLLLLLLPLLLLLLILLLLLLLFLFLWLLLLLLLNVQDKTVFSTMTLKLQCRSYWSQTSNTLAGATYVWIRSRSCGLAKV